MNRQFRVNGIEGVETHIEILEEVAGGYETRIISLQHSSVRESIEFMSEDLFNSCIRTGYLVPENPAYSQVVLTA